MRQVIIELTDVEYHALGTEAQDVHHLIENFARERARQIIERGTKKIISEKLEKGEVISGTKEQIFMSAGTPTLAESSDRFHKNGDTE